nr:hypothetical protein [uncultured Mucilaginibacter sp.]
MPRQLFIAYINTPNGTVLAGPVTVEKDEYLFVNKNTADDVYFNLKKSATGWYFSGGPSVKIPQEYIDSVGAQIDEYKKSGV